MSSALGPSPDVSTTLESVTEQLRWLQGLLLAEDTPDLRILTEFRDVVNRLRQTAWAVQQYGELIAAQTSSNPIATVLAGSASARRVNFVKFSRATWTTRTYISPVANCADSMTLCRNWRSTCASTSGTRRHEQGPQFLAAPIHDIEFEVCGLVEADLHLDF